MKYPSDPARWHGLFPHTATAAWLNHAADTPLWQPVQERLFAWYEEMAARPHVFQLSLDQARALIAPLIGAGAGEIALVPNTTAGVATVANGIDWQPGDNVVLPARQFPSNVYPWLALRRRGVEVRLVPPGPGGWTPAQLEPHVDRRTRVVAISSVEFLSGWRGDLAGTSALCRAHGAYLFVDGIQSVGVIPHDVRAEGVDFLSAGGFKWLMGPPATGFLYVRRELIPALGVALPGPLATESNIHDVEPRFDLWPDARRFEGGSLAWAEVHAWTGALELLGAAGLDRVWALAGARAEQAAAGLQELGYTLITPLEPAAGRSAIVSFTCGSAGANTAAFERLAQAGVHISLRLHGHVLRVSPHAYNTAAEVDRFLDALGRCTP